MIISDIGQQLGIPAHGVEKKSSCKSPHRANEVPFFEQGVSLCAPAGMMTKQRALKHPAKGTHKSGEQQRQQIKRRPHGSYAQQGADNEQEKSSGRSSGNH